MPGGEVRTVCPHLRVNPVTCTVRRTDIPPATRRPKPRQEVRPQQREETKQRKQEETKARARQRPGAQPQSAVEAPRLRRVRAPRPHSARPIPVAAVASVLTVIFVAANIDAIVAAVLYALVFAALTLAALAAGYANGRWVVPYLVRFVDEMLAERRDRAALRAVLSAPIPIEPVPEHDVQEWINRGLRNRRIDGYVAEPVERKR